MAPPPHVYDPLQQTDAPPDTDRGVRSLYTVERGEPRLNNDVSSLPFSAMIERLYRRRAASGNNTFVDTLHMPAQWHSPDVPNFSHDAWRSTKRGTNDANAKLEYWQLRSSEKDICDMTDFVAMQSLFKYLTRTPAPTTITPEFVYGSMHQLYRMFLYNKNWNNLVTYHPGTYIDDNTHQRIVANDSLVDRYDMTPQAYKETDRRIVVASIALLADDGVPLWEYCPNRKNVLQDFATQQAVADGRAIIEAAYSPVPYDRAKGFAVQVTL